MITSNNCTEDFQKESTGPKRIYKVHTCVDKDSINNVKNTLISKGISPDTIVEIENKCFISFTLDNKPDSSILTCSKSEWIVDEYKEIELLDGTGSGEFKFERAIFYRCNPKNIPLSQTFDNFDSLLQMYPVHYGEIRIKELNRQIESLKEKITKIEHKISLPKFKESDKKSTQRWLTDLAIVKNKLNTNLDEIRFIKDLWDELNKKIFEYTDENLSLRYRGIDELSILTNL